MDPRDAPLVLGLTATIIKGSAKKKEDFDKLQIKLQQTLCSVVISSDDYLQCVLFTFWLVKIDMENFLGLLICW
jgi:hypothetical protein